MGRYRFNYPGVPEEPGYYVYELWAAETCLYVGRVGNSGPQPMRRRLAGHRNTQPWFPQVTRIVVTAYSNHEEIAAEEPRRIAALQPLHNKAYAATCINGHERPPVAENYARGTCPECREEINKVYQPEYRRRPERVASERAREAGSARRRYYDSRNALPEVKERKKRWALRASRRPSPGQAGLF